MLTKSQLKHIEKRLLDERAKALRALGLFDEMTKADRESGDSDLSVYTDHMADQGTEAMEREKAALFATKEGRYLYRLEEALRRLYKPLPMPTGSVGSTRTPRTSAHATPAGPKSGSSAWTRCRMRGTASTASARKSRRPDACPTPGVMFRRRAPSPIRGPA